MHPTVSVVIPAYDAGSYVGAAVRSVLAQTHSALECIVVDDGSTDDTAAIVEAIGDERVRVLREPHRGSVSLARNRGIEVSTGELIAFLDADDIWHPDKLLCQVELFRRRPEVCIAWTAYVITTSDLTPLSEIHPLRSQTDLQAWLMDEGNGVLISSTGMVHRRALDAVGVFNPILSVSADLDFAERVVQRFPADFVDEVLVAYRTHGAQMHRRLDDMAHDMRWLFADRFADQRGRHARARANLATRLFVYSLWRRRPTHAVRQVGDILRRPDRFVLLPLEAYGRRRRRRRRTRNGLVDPRRWSTAG